MSKPAKALGFLLLLAVAVAGCKRKSGPEPARWYVERVAVNAQPLSGGGAALSTDELRKELIGALERSKRLVVLAPDASPPSGERPFKAWLDLAFVRDVPAEGENQRVAEAGVVLQLRRGGERLEAIGSGRERFTGTDLSDGDEARRAALRSAVTAAVELLVLELTAGDRSDEELIADLGSTDPRVRDFAVRTLAERRNAAAVPGLIERLNDPDQEVALRAIGALREIGDPAAVPALIELTSHKDPSTVAILLDVIASIGGKEAEAYLYTIASGHPDEAVRQAAEQAQKDLQTRAARRASPQRPPEEREQVEEQ